MPVKVNDSYLIPAPLVTFDKQYIVAGDGKTIGATYQVTLAGQILPNKGNPVVADTGGLQSEFADSGTSPWVATKSPDDDPLHNLGQDADLLSIMNKQEAIRQLFSENEGTSNVEIIDLNGTGKGIKFIGKVQSINFPSDGRWVLPCNYSISLTTNNFKESIDGDFSANGSEDSDDDTFYVQSASESWSFEESDTATDLLIEIGTRANRTYKIYRATHTVSAIGQPVFQEDGSSVAYKDGENSYNSNIVEPTEPWEQAKEYVLRQLGIGWDFSAGGLEIQGFGVEIFDLNNLTAGSAGNYPTYRAANRTVTENIDEKGGAYSITENFLIYPYGSYAAYEETSASVSKDTNSTTTVQIQGTITGLDTGGIMGAANPSGIGIMPEKDNIFNAKSYYQNVLTRDNIWKKALAISARTWLHPEPLSKSFSVNNKDGIISYSYSFDDRPPNIIRGSVSEDISISDTYPGQIFASIPVIGRNQPILQYVNSRSEYKRTLQINISMQPFVSNWGSITTNLSTGWTNTTINNNFSVDTLAIGAASGYWSNATSSNINAWFNQKPSILYASDFQKIYDAANPANEVGGGYANPVIPSKVFHSAPNESWNPKTGQYSYSIEWTYERTY